MHPVGGGGGGGGRGEGGNPRVELQDLYISFSPARSPEFEISSLWDKNKSLNKIK